MAYFGQFSHSSEADKHAFWETGSGMQRERGERGGEYKEKEREKKRESGRERKKDRQKE